MLTPSLYPVVSLLHRTVEVASSRLLEKSPSATMTWMTSQLVCNLIESVLSLWKLKMSPEFVSRIIEFLRILQFLKYLFLYQVIISFYKLYIPVAALV